MDIKTWFAKKDTGETTVNVEANLPLAKVGFDQVLWSEIPRNIAEIIAQKFLDQNGETLKRAILDNPNFADSVYNAIVLKKANEKLP